MNLMSYLSYLQSQLTEKKEQVNRLESSIRELEKIQNEFVHNRHSINDPELSSHTWKGQLANAFQEYREDLSLSYRDLYQLQLSEAITIFENKVTTLHYEIQTLQYNISQEVSRINEEKRKGDDHVG
jgi:prefoldin subunit 5